MHEAESANTALALARAALRSQDARKPKDSSNALDSSAYQVTVLYFRLQFNRKSTLPAFSNYVNWTADCCIAVLRRRAAHIAKKRTTESTSDSE